MQSSLSQLAKALEAVAANAEAMGHLRSVIMQLRNHRAPLAQQAGRYWAAGCGALMEISDTPDSDLTLPDILGLFAQGLHAWLEFTGTSATQAARSSVGRDDAGAAMLTQIGELCRLGAGVLAGDTTASADIEQRLQHLKSSAAQLSAATSEER